ncbi:hypothetical protein AAGG49_22115, partial [Stenotrophomonas maltophilia]|uniref:hypothetical protein n=1 Tax=Stenotrophomonas maltophilia TaxID=40324 RepID=UPI0031422CA0
EKYLENIKPNRPGQPQHKKVHPQTRKNPKAIEYQKKNKRTPNKNRKQLLFTVHTPALARIPAVDQYGQIYGSANQFSQGGA